VWEKERKKSWYLSDSVGQVCFGRLTAAGCSKLEQLVLFCTHPYFLLRKSMQLLDGFGNLPQGIKDMHTSSLLWSRTHLIWMCVLRNYSATFYLETYLCRPIPIKQREHPAKSSSVQYSSVIKTSNIYCYERLTVASKKAIYKKSGTHSDERFNWFVFLLFQQKVCNFLTRGGESVPRDLSTTCATVAPTYEANA
jgi:hypothetical protein